MDVCSVSLSKAPVQSSLSASSMSSWEVGFVVSLKAICATVSTTSICDARGGGGLAATT